MEMFGEALPPTCPLQCGWLAGTLPTWKARVYLQRE